MEMVPHANIAPTETDNIDPVELYVVVRKAMKDAILSVIGTLLMVGLEFVLVWFGALVAVSAYVTSPVMALAGVPVVLFGLYQAASVLGVIPSVTDFL